MGFNPMQGRRPKAADLAIFVLMLAVVVGAVLWGFRVY